MEHKVMPSPMQCSCGAYPRIRYRIPVVWVECRRKCGMKTGFYPDKAGTHDPDSEAEAIMAWNRMVSEKCRKPAATSS
jgi:hypothetical protein